MKCPSLRLLLLLAFGLTSHASAEEEPKVEMGRMQMVLLSRTPGAPAAKPDSQSVAAQAKAVDALLQSGRLVFAGRSTGDGNLREILILKSAETNAARELAASLPAVRSGHLTPEPLLWFGPVNLFKPAGAGAAMTNYVFGLLLRGTNSAKLPPAEVTKIQEGHMANIRRLGKEGKLSIAGPFVEGGDRRGIFMFKLADQAEAQTLADTDPAVIAGRLRIELHPIQAPAGLIP